MVDVRRLPVGEDNEGRVSLDGLAREGARRMIAAALEAGMTVFDEAVNLLFVQLAQALGGRIRLLISGGAALPEDLGYIYIGAEQSFGIKT